LLGQRSRLKKSSKLFLFGTSSVLENSSCEALGMHSRLFSAHVPSALHSWNHALVLMRTRLEA
jgi:hypothetical protein